MSELEAAIPERVAIPIVADPPPLATLVPGVLTVGTGFLARRSGHLGLYTGAHVPVGKQPYATSGWLDWPRVIHPYTSPLSRLDLQMFTHSIPTAPSFEWLLNPPGLTGRMADMMAFKQATHSGVLSELEQVYAVVDLDNVTPPDVGDELFGFGYPDLGGDAKWPYAPASVCCGPMVGIVGALLRADMVLESGFSGGPVYRSDGLFAGMVIGSDPRDGLANIVTPPALQQL